MKAKQRLSAKILNNQDQFIKTKNIPRKGWKELFLKQNKLNIKKEERLTDSENKFDLHGWKW